MGRSHGPGAAATENKHLLKFCLAPHQILPNYIFKGKRFVLRKASPERRNLHCQWIRAWLLPAIPTSDKCDMTRVTEGLLGGGRVFFGGLASQNKGHNLRFAEGCFQEEQVENQVGESAALGETRACGEHYQSTSNLPQPLQRYFL